MRDLILNMREEAKSKKQAEKEELITLYNSDNVVENLFNVFEKKFKKLIEKSSEELCTFNNLTAILVTITELKVDVNREEIVPYIKFDGNSFQLLNDSTFNNLREDIKDWRFEYFHEANFLPKECWNKLVEKFQKAEYTVKVLLHQDTNYMIIILKI